MSKSKINTEYFKSIFNNVDVSIADHELIYNENGEAIDYKFLYANKAFCESINTSLENLIGKTVLDLFPETEKYWIDKYSEVVATGESLSMTRYSAQFDKQFSIYAFKSNENSFVTSFFDITNIIDRFKETNIIKPEYRVSQGIAKVAFFEVNRLTYSMDTSESFSYVVGLESVNDGFFSDMLVELTHHEDKKVIAAVIKAVLNGKAFEQEAEFQMFNKRENKFHWMSFSAFAIESDENGIPFRYSGLVRDIQEEKVRSEELKQIEYLFKEAKKVADLTTFIYRTDTNEFDFSQELDDFTGLTNLRTITQFKKIIHPEDLGIYDDATNYTLRNAEGRVAVYRIIKDNKTKFIQSSVYALTDKKGKIQKVFGILKDITEIEESRRNALEAQRSFELIFNSSPAGIITLNKEFEITMENKTFREMFNSKENEIKIKYLLGDEFDKVIKELEKNDFSHVIIERVIKNEMKHFAVNIVRIDEKFDNECQGTVIDITEQERNREKISYLASHDVLTELHNRNYFEDIIVNKKLNYPLGIIMCDIDGLKLINDAFGHLEGDKLLKLFAKELKRLSSSYIVSRIGGDEFAVLVKNATEDELDEFSEKIKESVHNIKAFKVDWSVSVGYSILVDENSDFNRVFNKAENMMYRRKLTERKSRKSNALSTIMETLHEKTEETMNHCKRVGDYATMILSDYGHKRIVDLDDIRFLSDVHDVGKIAIPEGILSKKTKLTDSEYEEIKYHCEAGYKIIRNIIDKDEIAYGVLYHHERYDGKGYPHGLKGDNIPLYARILNIADSYDTMIRGRVYQKPISKKEALLDIKNNSGTQFDPNLAANFIRLMEEIND